MDKIKQVPAYFGNYTDLREGSKISEITIHHAAFVGSAEDIGRVFQQVGRNGSSHYGIGVDGDIAQFVAEKDTAWTNSNWNANKRSVTIEVSNSSTGGKWPVSDKSLNALIELVADIARRNKLYPLVKGKNLTWHQMYAATACPGEYLLSKMDDICQTVNEMLKPKKQGWEKDTKGWRYLENGKPIKDAWRKDSKGWCYLGSDGYMAKDRWVADSVDWCYVGSDGYLVTDKLISDSNGICYVGSDGRILRNQSITLEIDDEGHFKKRRK